MGISYLALTHDTLSEIYLSAYIARRHGSMQMPYSRILKGFGREDGIISLIIGPIIIAVIFLLGLLFQHLKFSTPDQIKELRGQGRAQTYNYPYEKVFQTTLDLINEKKLTIVESNSEKQYMIIADGSGFVYEGRIMALFFSSDSSNTKLEIVSKFTDMPPLKDLILPENSPSKILNELGKHLDSNNGLDNRR